MKNRKALSIWSQMNIVAHGCLSLPNGAGQSFNKADEFVVALRKALTEAADIEQLFAIWERNVDAVRAINKHTNRSTPRGVIAQNLVAHLKGRAIALAKQGSEASERHRTIGLTLARRWTRVCSPSPSRSVSAQRSTSVSSPASLA